MHSAGAACCRPDKSFITKRLNILRDILVVNGWLDPGTLVRNSDLTAVIGNPLEWWCLWESLPIYVWYNKLEQYVKESAQYIIISMWCVWNILLENVFMMWSVHDPTSLLELHWSHVQITFLFWHEIGCEVQYSKIFPTLSTKPKVIKILIFWGPVIVKLWTWLAAIDWHSNKHGGKVTAESSQ